MPLFVNGERYYRTSEACKRAGISKSTFLRWLKEGILKDVSHADRRGWRLFTDEDINTIKAEATKIKIMKLQ
jgi:excisionase family DNA binding protein